LCIVAWISRINRALLATSQDLYDKKTKAPKAWTPELVTVLESLLKKNPHHPGAHQQYIRAHAASATAEKGSV
jgi:hypothetical protein